MRWPLAMFGSRVAWRVFARFLLASFLPLAALSALFLAQVSRTFEQHAVEELDATSRAIGQVVLDKLLAASDLLAVLAERPAPLDLRAFGLTAAAYTADGRTTSFGPSFELPPLPPMLDPTKPILRVIPKDATQDVFIARAVDRGTIVGLLDPSYLEMATALASGGEETCIFAGSLSDAPIHCSAALPAAARRELSAVAGRDTTGHVTWSERGETWLAAYWELFIPSRFHGEPWQIVVAAPRSLAFESLGVFNSVAPQALVLCLVLIVLASVVHIRRTLGPLGNLVAATKRIAAQDFTTRVAIAGSDEFASLGRAMNDMTDRLGRQFGTLTTLAEIDRLILSSESIEEVLQAVLERASANLPVFQIAVLLTDQDDELHGRLYRRAPNATLPTAVVALSERERDTLLAATEGALLDPTHDHDGSALTGPARPGARVFAVPILRGRALGGALLATLPDSPPDSHDLTALRELAGRLAVALSSTEREEALIQWAHFDPLTGMPNRRLSRDRLQQALAQARRDDHRVAVLFIDIDGFKNINDSLGHVAGDEVLKEIALRLVAAARDTDTVGRFFGGDEYVVILPGLRSVLEIEPVLERIMAALQRPFSANGRESFITGSIGVTLFPEDGASADDLLRKADTAMYSAKAAGRARWVYFTKEMDSRVQERLALANDLHGAIERGELCLVYQPQVTLAEQRVVGAEALLRWRHPTRGLVSPSLFVPIMEETGLIETVGTWVLQTALRDLASWQAAGLPIGRVGVNVAARQLLDPGLVDTVSDSLRSAGLGGSCLELELTETTLVSDLHAANSRLAELAERGVRIAVDDFGTGYSSLSYLNELTFDALKIDRAFVIDLPAEKSVAIIKAIVAVARALGKEVVAEGIETELQRVHLAHLGCDLAQGYLFSEPLEPAAFARWLEKGTLPARKAVVN
jgi:diguanylate cyclase (GGDEF)-like protein